MEEKIKVLLVTLQGDNIGNRLQNYALQKVLQKRNCDVWNPYYDDNDEIDDIFKKCKLLCKIFLGKLKFERFKVNYIRFKRKEAFKEFDDKYISNQFKINFGKTFEKNWNQYDLAITGSDQVWHNWYNSEYELRYFYLEFIDKDKRGSYAPSFGFDDFPQQDLEFHRDGLSGIKYLSSRENKGIELIKTITGKDAKLVLDPTILLERNEWEIIEKKPKNNMNGKYVLVYFLGNMDAKEDIYNFAKKRDLALVNAFDPESLNSQLITPDNFVWLVHNAEYVFTDSFHASVFSILFNKKFLVFRRKENGMEGMFDRIQTLMDIFGTESRIYNGNVESIIEGYQVNDIEELRQESLRYIDNMLKMK